MPGAAWYVCLPGESGSDRQTLLDVDVRIGFWRGPAVTARNRDAGDDFEYRCRTHPLLVGPHQGQTHRPRLGPGLHIRHAVSTDLFDPIGLADGCGGSAGDDRPAQRTDPRL